MRWEDEQFVKVYTRDTGEWLALGWEAQALFLFMLRKSDRAGIVHTGKAKARGLAAMVGMPPEVLERALAALLADGCVREAPAAYLIPNFVAAQEARQTDRARKAAQRQRDRDEAASHGVTQPAVADAMATMERHESHEVTPAVTRRHTASHGVTLRRDETRVDETRREDPPNPPKGAVSSPAGQLADSIRELMRQVDAAWEWTPGSEQQLRGVLALPGATEAEVLRRLRIAVSTKYPRFLGLPSLKQHWTAYASPEAQGPPAKPQRRDIQPSDYREGPVERL